jgi:hypothetical protein
VLAVQRRTAGKEDAATLLTARKLAANLITQELFAEAEVCGIVHRVT